MFLPFQTVNKLLKKASRYRDDVSIRDALVFEDKGNMLTQSIPLLALSVVESSFGAPIETISVKGAYRIQKADTTKNSKEVIVSHGYSQIINK